MTCVVVFVFVFYFFSRAVLGGRLVKTRRPIAKSSLFESYDDLNVFGTILYGNVDWHKFCMPLSCCVFVYFFTATRSLALRARGL